MVERFEREGAAGEKPEERRVGRARAAMEGRDWDRRALPVCAGAVLATTLVAEVLLVLLRFLPPGEPLPVWPIASLLFLLANALENARRFIMASPSTRGVMLAGEGQGWE